jgi:hypothetical protein
MTFDEIKTALAEGVCNVTFTKLDGNLRIMRCTLKQDLIPADKFPRDRTQDSLKNENRKPRTDFIAVWDLDKNDWRSFRMDRVDTLEKVVE